MINRSITAPQDCASQSTESTVWQTLVRDLGKGFALTTYRAVQLLGVLAIGTLALLFIRPELADRLQQLSPFSVAEDDAALAELAAAQADFSAFEHASAVHPAALMAPAAPQASNGAPAGKAEHANNQQQQWVTQWLSKRYRVAHDATNMLVSAAYTTATETKLDPLLILAVMAIESGLNPFAESPVGAQGLMQVMSKVHHDKFQDLGGVKAALNPVANIKVGSLILKDYVTRGGSVEAGLKMYVGAAAFDSDFGYGSKVLAEYRRLKDVALGRKVSTTTRAVPAAPKPESAQTVEAKNQTEAEQPKQSRLDSDLVAAL